MTREGESVMAVEDERFESFRHDETLRFVIGFFDEEAVLLIYQKACLRAP